MPQPCINCAADGRCMKRQAPQEAADAEIPNTFKLPGETDDQWIDRITGAQAAPAAVAEPNTPFADQRVQIVYGLLADSEAMPPDGQHWEGWVARRIVDALAAAPAAAQPPCDPTKTECPRCKNNVLDQCPVYGAPAAAQPVAQHPTLLQCVREMLEFQSAKEGPSIHDWGRWRRAADAADTTPPALVGLSDAQIMHLWFAAEPTPDGRPASWNYARAVERAMAAANGMTLKEPAGKDGAAKP